MILIKPRPGLDVIDPNTRLMIPRDGILVSANDLYWHRRIMDGDVVIAKPPRVKRK